MYYSSFMGTRIQSVTGLKAKICNKNDLYFLLCIHCIQVYRETVLDLQTDASFVPL